MRNIIIIGLFLLSCTISLQGQPSANDELRVENRSIELSGEDVLHISLDLVMPEGFRVTSGRMVTFTPIIRGAENQEFLPPVHVYGRRRMIVSERENRLPEDGEGVFRRANRTEQAIHYTASLPLEPWMNDAELVIEQDLCGCGNLSEEITYLAVSGIDLPQPPALPGLLYRVPEAEVVKRRVFKGEAYIDYPINEIVIYPDYMRNTAELAKIDSTLRGFEISEIESIALHGFASPEGPYDNNVYLANGRTEALKTYIMQKFRIPASIIGTTSTPENWEGFIRLAESSQLQEKARILEIARKDIEPDKKEAELKSMPAAFRHMTTHWFPVLRHTNYEIEYVLPDFTAQEARGVAQEDPTRLSLREIYDAAQLSGKGSEEYHKLMEAAVRVYPDHPDANLNAATSALERGDLQAAERYMEKADPSTPEAKNNMEYIKLLKERQ